MIRCFRTLQQEPNGTGLTLTEYDFLSPPPSPKTDLSLIVCGAQAELRSVFVRTPLLNRLGMQFTKSVPRCSSILAKAGTYDPLPDPIASPGIIFASNPVPRFLFPIRRSGFPAGAYPSR